LAYIVVSCAVFKTSRDILVTVVLGHELELLIVLQLQSHRSVARLDESFGDLKEFAG
jgi:hypothetical protein